MPLTIEKLIYGGDGLARLPADDHGRSKAVFVPFVLAGEKIEATLTEQKPSFARARADAIVEPSPHRVAPQCPYFTTCGGCHYQQATYEHQLEIKKEILRENLKRIAKLDLPCEIELHPSPPWNYRNRSRLQVRHKPDFAAGYFELASHDLLPVEQCPISSLLINRAITAIWQVGRAAKVPAGIREVELFANADDTRLLAELTCGSEVRRATVRTFAEDLQSQMPEIAGIAAFRDAPPGERSATGEELLLAHGDRHLTYQTQRAAYRVSAGSFFQSNRFLIDELVRIVTQGRSGELALDLYAGVGLFSTALARDIRHIICVEASQTSAADLAYNLPPNGRVMQSTTEQYLSRADVPGRQRKGAGSVHGIPQPDLAVVDPARTGLGERVARALADVAAPRITYVSCDPATLARDLVILLAAGYKVEEAHLVDLFPQTYHIETVLHLTR